MSAISKPWRSACRLCVLAALLARCIHGAGDPLFGPADAAGDELAAPLDSARSDAPGADGQTPDLPPDGRDAGTAGGDAAPPDARPADVALPDAAAELPRPGDAAAGDDAGPIPGIPCSERGDCLLALPARHVCEEPACVEGRCVRWAVADCCTDDAHCIDWDPCNVDRCIGTVCEYAPGDVPQCCAGTLLAAYDFETEADFAQFGRPDAAGAAAVGWHRSQRYHTSGLWAAAFGDPAEGSYATGNRVRGDLRGPALELPLAGRPVFSFDLLLDTEWRMYTRAWADPSPFVYDRLTLSIDDGVDTTPVWSSYAPDVRGTTCDASACRPRRFAVDLSAYLGRTVRPVFTFDSGDGTDNDYAGAFVDHIEARMVCGPQPACYSTVDCDDENPCTDDLCAAGACEYEPSQVPGCCYPFAYMTYDFESGQLQGFAVDPSTSPVQWQVTAVRAAAGLYSLGFFDAATGGYADGARRAQGTVRGPVYTLPNNVRIALAFWLFVDVAEPTRDVLAVRLFDNQDGSETELFRSTTLTPRDLGRWVEVTVPLATWAQRSVRFVFAFDTLNGLRNEGSGVYVDSVRTIQTCP